MKRFVSIRTKIVFCILCIYLVFVTIAFVIWHSSLRKEAERMAVSNMKMTLDIANTSFERQLKDIINVTALTTVRSSNTLSTNIINIMAQENLTPAEIVAYRNEALDYLVSLCSFKKHLNGLMLSDLKGKNTVTYGINTPYEYILEKRYIEELAGMNGNIFLEPHFTSQWYQNKNDLVFSVLRPVFDFGNRYIGFAVADINCQLFGDCYDVDPQNQSAFYVINDSTGKIIYAPDNNVLHMKSEDTFSEGILACLTESNGNFFYDINNENMLIVYHKSEMTGWCTLNVIPESYIIDEFSQAEGKNLMITLVLMLVLVLLVYAVCTYLTNNIIRLTGIVRQVGVEGLKTDISIEANDEVGMLATQFSSMLERIEQLLQDVKTEEAKKRNAEISALQYQMNPHFLYNSLNTIKFLANLQGTENIGLVAEALSSLMHISMAGKPFIFIREDREFIQSYLLLQSYRNISFFRYDIQVGAEVEECVLPKLLIQPLVENALKHGIPSGTVDGILLVSYKKQGDNLQIIVEDNGVGMSEGKIQEILQRNGNTGEGHIGIYNVQERIRLYFGENYGLRVESSEGLYTRFVVTIPFLRESDVEKL